MSTDVEWEKWGARDPYFGVITDPRFRSANLTPEARQAFFDGGRHHVLGVLDNCRRRLIPDFAPKRILDFGCGVGRLVIPFAETCAEVVGVDVSASMLAEARRNCDEYGVAGVQLLPSDDALSSLQGTFDLVHSALVFQHIEVKRGRALFARLLDCIAPGGIGAIQITYAKAYHPDTFGQPPAPPPAPAPGKRSPFRKMVRREDSATARAESPGDDPQMLMNPYNLTELAFMLQRAGVPRFHAEFTNDGGELGVYLYFQRPPA